MEKLSTAHGSRSASPPCEARATRLTKAWKISRQTSPACVPGRGYSPPGIFSSGGVPITRWAWPSPSPAHFEMELELAKVLQHDLLKSYVRLPDLQQKRMVEFAHSIGIPVTTHEIYPAAFVGVDATSTWQQPAAESTRQSRPPCSGVMRTSCRLFGQSQRYLTPTVSAPGTAKLFEDEPEMKSDPRFTIYSDWLRQFATVSAASSGICPRRARHSATIAHGKREVRDRCDACGSKIVAGTDTPNAFALHGELETYVMAGMTPYEAFRAATVTPAEELNLDAGSIEPGKLADIVIVSGNPLEDIANAHKVKEVIANGRLYTVEDLVSGNIHSIWPTNFVSDAIMRSEINPIIAPQSRDSCRRLLKCSPQQLGFWECEFA